MCPSTAYRYSNTFHMLEEDFGTLPCWVGLEPQPVYDGILCGPGVMHDFIQLPTSGSTVNTCSGSGMIKVPCAHPQHMKVIKYLSYVGRGCGIHSMLGKSLNHCTMTATVAQQ